MAFNKQFYDIPYEQKNEVVSYVDAYDIKNNNIDFDYIKQFEQSLYVSNSYSFEQICERINNMQNYFFDNIDVFLNEQKDKFFAWIDDLKEYQTYDSTIAYNKNTRVHNNNGNIYLSLKDNNTSPLTDGTSWLPIYVKGEQGDYGYNLNYRGEYNWEFNRYNRNDVVFVQHVDTRFYICINDNIEYSATTYPWQDTDNWVYLFSVVVNQFKIFDEQPSPNFLNSLTAPYVYGVKDGAYNTQFYLKDVGMETKEVNIYIDKETNCIYDEEHNITFYDVFDLI